MNDNTVEISSEQLKKILDETDDQFKIVPLSEQYVYDPVSDRNCYQIDATELATGNVYRFKYFYDDPDCYYFSYDEWSGHLIS